MKLMKKLSLFMAVVMVLALFCGCDAKNPTSKETDASTKSSVEASTSADDDDDPISSDGIAYYINDTGYPIEVLNLFYLDSFISFLSTYGSYAAYFGLDTSTGIVELENQTCDYSADKTWRGFFLEDACSNLLYVVALNDCAKANNFTCTDEDEAFIQEQLDALAEVASDEGYESSEAYLKEMYQADVTLALYEEHLRMATIADAVYAAYSDSLSFTEDAIKSQRASLGYDSADYDYSLVSMRHILVMAEAGSDGTYSEEAIQAAHDAAVEIYNEWLASDQSDETFASMVEKYTDDTASIEDGGLYDQIYKGMMVEGIEDWLFTEGRKLGDVAVIDNNGSYVGTHVVLFAGEGENYGMYLAESDLKDSALSDWLDDVVYGYTAKEGSDYTNAARFKDIF